MQRISVPRGLAVVGVVIPAFGLIFSMGSLLATQLTQLAGDLPSYQSISEKIQSFRDKKAGRGTVERASDMLKDLNKELDKPKDAPSARAKRTVLAPGVPGRVAPVPVEVRKPDPGALESLRTLISRLVHPLATTGIIIIFVLQPLACRARRFPTHNARWLAISSRPNDWKSYAPPIGAALMAACVLKDHL